MLKDPIKHLEMKPTTSAVTKVLERMKSHYTLPKKRLAEDGRRNQPNETLGKRRTGSNQPSLSGPVNFKLPEGVFSPCPGTGWGRYVLEELQVNNNQVLRNYQLIDPRSSKSPSRRHKENHTRGNSGE